MAGGLSGAADQIAQNVTHGQPWNQNLDQATAQGLAAGGALGLAGVGLSAATDALSSADATATDGALAATNSTTTDGTLPTDTTDATDSSTTSAACAGGLSFSADTLVQTPSGEQPIARLQVGEHVTSYDPTTGKATTQTITHVFVNQDSDRLDVTLALPATDSAALASWLLVGR